jgi:hypothetical protein
MAVRALGLGLALAAAAGCSGAAGPGTATPARPLEAPAPGGSLGRIEQKQLDARPRLSLIARDGDPSPAVVIAVATDLGPAPTTALAAVVEARLRAAGFEADTRVDRSAFRVRIALGDGSRAAALFAAAAAAFARPVAAGGPEIALAADRLRSLQRNPLDAAELAPIAACTGALGIAPGEAVLDAGSPAGAPSIEAFRAEALGVARTSIAAVGPAAFGAAVAAGLAASPGWPAGSPPADAWPAADAIGVYTAQASADRRGARLTVAVRTGDPEAAASAAERLGAAESPLVARLRALDPPWRVIEVVGSARPRGGCVSAAIEALPRGPGLLAGLRDPAAIPTPEATAAVAGALVRSEIAAEIAGEKAPAIAARQILTAADAREAASRAAWWALASAVPGSPDRWAIALGEPPSAAPPGKGAPAPAEPSLARFGAELAARAGAAAPIERRIAVERGQGDLWVLLASPCGVAEEGADDAGFGALGMIASVEALRREGEAAIEPWITADGLGVVAHATFRDDRETPADLARRVGSAAARALAAAWLTPEAVAGARAAQLDRLSRTEGREGAAAAVLAGAIAPEHPSWVDPLGVWGRLAGAGLEGARLRRQAIASGPLRLAVLANADAAQAAAAGDAADRWFRPSAGPRACRAGSSQPPRPGRYEARLPSDTLLAQALLGAPIPAPGAPGRDLAELTALALNGDRGLLGAAFRESGAVGSARILGGSRAPVLVVDVRAPPDALATAVTEAKALLGRLDPQVADADLARASAEADRLEREGRADPRGRLADLWSGRKPGPPARPALAAWKAFLAGAFPERALTVVEARPE